MEAGRYFIYLSYKGTGYSGWQVQPGEKTVQGTLEEALSVIMQEEIKVTGAGRTDTGVHASSFVAHFDTAGSDLDESDLVYKLDCYLPRDIAISALRRVKANAHARFDALSRTYTYYISRVKDPFAIKQVSYIRGELDVERMNLACSYLTAYSDFTSFSKLHTDVKTNNCKIYFARWVEEGTRLIFEIKADRFLRNMVRAIVGTMLDIGSGKISPEDIRTIIESKNRSSAGKSASADGLFLTAIEYPDAIFPAR